MKKLYTFLFFTLVGLNTISSATFSSVSSGTWSAPATWTVTSGTDADGIPDADDDVTINAGHNVSLSLANSYVKAFTNNGTLIGNSKKFNSYGNFTNNGSISGIVLYIHATCVFASLSPFSGAISWWINGNLTIAPGTSISTYNALNVYSGRVVSNLGSVYLGGVLVLNGTGSWINGTNSSLTLNANITNTGSLIASSNGNTVLYRGVSCNQIKSAIYYNLTIASANTTTRTATGNITVLNNFLLGSGGSNTFDLAGYNLTVGGNWMNMANRTIINQGVVTFNTSTTQNISRPAPEFFSNMVIAGTGTTSLAQHININQNLTINGGVLDVSSSNFTIDIKGNFVNNGAINCRSGLISFTGSSAQTISGTQGTSFNDLTTANTAGVSVLSNVSIFYMLRVNSGGFGTAGSGVITIPASGPTTYARIGIVSGSLFGSGWVIESYIDGPAPAGWQWLSSTTSNSTLADWDNDPRFYMSGVGGNDGNSMSGSGIFYSVRTYNEVTNSYTNITTTSTPLLPGKGFRVWMSDNTTGLTAPLVYNSNGTPNFGTVNYPVTAGGAGSGYNLVGNPYACPITYTAVVAASGNLYNDFIILQEDNTYATNPNGGVISPNQGFMCCAFSSGNITFTEACKNINGNPNILKTAPAENAVSFSVYNNVNGIGGRTYIDFTEDATDNFENGTDLAFLASPSEESDNIFSKSLDQVALLRNKLANSGEEKQVSLTVKSGVYGSHFISAKGLSGLTLYNSIWLEDLTTGKKVDLLNHQEYEFNAEEIGKDYEFIIHFSNSKKSTENTGITTANFLLNENTAVYNTPSSVVIKFSMDESTPVTISVFNLSGQKVMETIKTNVTNDRIALPVQKENGLYLLIIQSENEQITRKIIY
jgi:hypothetical protein